VAKDRDRPIPDADLSRLAALASESSPAPWVSFVGPGIGGDDFIRVGEDDHTEADMYVSREGEPASAANARGPAARTGYALPARDHTWPFTTTAPVAYGSSFTPSLPSRSPRAIRV
jgi:hypothetical protein